jgi:hypothetical protein
LRMHGSALSLDGWNVIWAGRIERFMPSSLDTGFKVPIYTVLIVAIVNWCVFFFFLRPLFREFLEWVELYWNTCDAFQIMSFTRRFCILQLLQEAEW